MQLHPLRALKVAIAMQCIEGEFQGERFPIFITLKDFAEAPEQPSILNYIAQQLSKCKVTDANVKGEQLLEQGKVLVLLDGLDEVREEDTKRVLDQVQEFSYQFSTNQFIITCRIAAKQNCDRKQRDLVRLKRKGAMPTAGYAYVINAIIYKHRLS